MLFNSFEFLLFFPVVTILFFLLPHRFRWVLLLGASCFFYMFFKPVYILILLFTIVIDYFAGIWIEEQEVKKKRKQYLIVSLIANIGVLAIFKYYNFIAINLNALASSLGSGVQLNLLEILLPIGLSFHTFQAMSYTIEVYRGNQKAERHFGIYALYVMFYPQLVAGPIERPQNVLHQFHEVKYFNMVRFQSGLRLILWGLVKKTVVADRLAIPVNELFNSPYSNWSGLSVIVASVFFAIQIYCDFSGYSDIAIGSARAMGYDLMTNFRQPYLSTNISEFWKRWHISLSTWFRDYLYIPLGGNRTGKYRTYFNLWVVFLVSGLWHGANWTFIIWGGIHGSFLVLTLLLSPLLGKLHVPKFFSIAFTFSIVCVAWVYFRANDLSQANHLLSKVIQFTPDYFSLGITSLHGLPNSYLSLPLWKFLLTFSLVPLVLISDHFLYTQKQAYFYTLPPWVKWGVYYALILSVLFFGVFETNQFIYFQF